MLDTEGFCAEGSGENLFIIRDGKIKTAPLTCVLPGITRDTIMTLARENNIPIEEQRFSRDELYIADEAFFTGTAAEVTPIREVDSRRIGKGERGPHHRRSSRRPSSPVVRGENPKYAAGSTSIPRAAPRRNRRSRRKRARNRLLFGRVVQARPVEVDRLHHFDQLVEVPGLDEIRVGLQSVRPLDVLGVQVRRQHDHGQVAEAVVLPDPSQHFEPRHAGTLEVAG
jgi:hypothetical protein